MTRGKALGRAVIFLVVPLYPGMAEAIARWGHNARALRTVISVVLVALCCQVSIPHALTQPLAGASDPGFDANEGQPTLVTAAAQGTDRVVTPDDELFEQYQWNLRRLGLPQAWGLTTGSPSVIIAILDTGVSHGHPDLARKLIPGYDFVNDSGFPDDDHGNGTHVAGIAAAETNNRSGIAGIAWQARLMPVKVLDRAAYGDPARAAQGVVWAVDHGASIINLGLAGTTRSPELEEAIRYAYDRGVLTVAPVASNGTSEVSYPAASPYVLAVSATDRQDRRLPSSNTGDYISVAAPGEQVASTFRSPGGADTYAVAGTTAQAAAQVTGVAALLLAINPQLRPDDIRSILEASADDAGPPGRDSETGFGRINAARATLFAAPWNFLSKGAGSYAGISAPARTAYFPLVMKESNGWNTAITVQNTSSRQTSVALTFLTPDGGSVYTQASTLSPAGSTTYQPARMPGLPVGFAGSALVQADGLVAAIANHDRPGGDRLTYEGISTGVRRIWLPLLMRGNDGWESGFVVQNSGSAPANVRVRLYGREGLALVERTFRLAPLASRALYLPAEEQLPQPWIGSATVEALDDQPLAAVANQLRADGAGMSYVGVSRPFPVSFAPLLFKNAGDWDTGVQLQNPLERFLRVRATFRQADITGGLWSEEVPIPAGGSVTLYQPSAADLPDNFVGSAVLFAVGGEPIGAVVNQVAGGSGSAMSYTAQPSGADTVYLPLVYRGFAGWSSGLQVQNTAQTAAVVSVSFQSEEGTTIATYEETVNAEASRSFYLPALQGLPGGFVGSAVVVSVNGQPIVAVANHTK